MTSNFSYNTVKHFYEILIHYTLPELEQLRNDIDATEEYFKSKEQELINLKLKPKKSDADLDTIKAIKENLDSVKNLRGENAVRKYVIEELIAKDLEPVPPATTASALAAQHAAAIASSIHTSKKQKKENIASSSTQIEPISEKEMYAMFMSNFTDDQIYTEFSKYDTDALRETYKRSADQIKVFDKLVEEKAYFDLRKGRKPKKYASIIASILKYKETYNFLKRTQSVIQKIIKERQAPR